jgi:hypothetical protein
MPENVQPAQTRPQGFKLDIQAKPQGLGLGSQAPVKPQPAPVRPQGFKLDIQPSAKPQGFKLDNQPIGPVKEAGFHYQEITKKNWDYLMEAIEDFKNPGLWNKAWAGLETANAAVNWLASPAESAIRRVVGDPLEMTTGMPHLGEKIGEAGSLGLQLVGGDPVGLGIRAMGAKGVNPMIGLAETGAEKLRAGKLGKGIEEGLSPGTVTPRPYDISQGVPAIGMKPAERTESVIRAHNAAFQLETQRAMNELDQYRGVIMKLPFDARVDFMDHIETGEIDKLPGQLRPAAQQIRKILDATRDRIRSLGEGYLDSFNKDYFPHIWKDPEKARIFGDEYDAMEEAVAAGQSKRPILGSKAFLKPRTVPTIKAGLNRGLELVTTDPIEMALLKLREMNKFYYGTNMVREVKASNLAKFVKTGGRKPYDWVALEDSAFQARLPPAVAEHHAAFDPGIRHGLQDVAQAMGVNIKRPLNDAYMRKTGAFGYTGKGMPHVVTRFGNYDTVLMHEIGHQLDFKLHLNQKFQQNPQAWDELGELAKLRAPGIQNKQYLDYLLNPPERLANYFHARWHAPELLDQFAPNAKKVIEGALQSQLGGSPAGQHLLKAINSVHPTVQVAGEKLLEHFPGIRDLGRWYAPPDVARVFNNYVGKGLAGHNGLYDAMRSVGNGMVSSQLSLSAFHAMFTSLDAVTSDVALGIEQIARGEPIRGAKNLFSAAAPPIAAVKNVRRGARLRTALLNPGNATPELQRMVDALIQGGGRAKMDDFWRLGQGRGILKPIFTGQFRTLGHDLANEFQKGGYWWGPFKAAGSLISRGMNDLSWLILEYLVPRQKLGVFYNMASDWMRVHPNATRDELRQGMGLIWDSVDNRMGQMTYDNVFWNKTAKDVAFMSVRSVGWNLGTFRELGGGVADAAKQLSKLNKGQEAELTHRMAYAIVLPMTTALWGAVIQYLYTGHGPETLLDYFYPKNGKNTPYGAEDRVSVPSYIKDVVGFSKDPVQTAQNKLNPMFGTMWGLYENQDFYGATIADPNSSLGEYIGDVAGYMAKAYEPFSFQAMKRLANENASWGAMVGGMFGIQPAPGYIVDPERQQGFEERRLKQGLRRREKERELYP